LCNAANVVVLCFCETEKIKPTDIEAGSIVGVDIADNGIECGFACEFEKLLNGDFVAAGFFDTLIFAEVGYPLKYPWILSRNLRQQVPYTLSHESELLAAIAEKTTVLSMSTSFG
jgi:hypothetical protein